MFRVVLFLFIICIVASDSGWLYFYFLWIWIWIETMKYMMRVLFTYDPDQPNII